MGKNPKTGTEARNVVTLGEVTQTRKTVENMESWNNSYFYLVGSYFVYSYINTYEKQRNKKPCLAVVMHAFNPSTQDRGR